LGKLIPGKTMLEQYARAATPHQQELILKARKRIVDASEVRRIKEGFLERLFTIFSCRCGPWQPVGEVAEVVYQFHQCARLVQVFDCD
jgi:hypothetical protein